LSHDEVFTIGVNDLNEAPKSLTLTNATVRENSAGGTSIGTLTGVDPDAGSTLSYKILNDPDGKFQIVNNELQVRAGAAIDFEAKASHQVTIRVTDQAGLFYDKVFAVAVGNVNEAPSSLTLSNARINENSPGGTLIGSLAAVDPDTGSVLAYSIQSDPDGKFQVVGNRLLVRSGAVLDYEAKTSHQVTLKVTDQGNLTYEKLFTISLNDIKNEKLKGTAGSDVLRSGAYDDTLDGSASDDRLYSGAGRDVLKGGSGRDTFVFNARPSSVGYDKILDFNHADDTFWLAKSAFSKLAVGNLKSGAFWSGAHAHDASDRVIYDKTTGALYYDSDGTGHAAQIKIAILSNKAMINAHDFVVV